MLTKIQDIPTNIISGFLGVGKTTAILHLFSNKPATEKWAVLVNEFGKIGIDGHLYQSNGIAVKEIPGGCMCCAQGLPLQVAVNRLLRETQPDRLIIESSGIGHPAGVLKTLTGESFNKVLTLKSGICLLDPENLIRPEFQNNELFKEQIQLADVLVANKTDLASVEALQAFQQLSESLTPAKKLITTTRKGQLSIGWLQYDHIPYTQSDTFKLMSGKSKNWQTHSFRYQENMHFDLELLKRWLEKINVTRLKGIIKTADSYYLLNISSGHMDISELAYSSPPSTYNYIEVIDDNLNVSGMEKDLNNCIRHH
jgi:G3E family GTPase